MNPNESTSNTDERVLQSLRAHQRGLRWLTGLAITFWITAVLASVSVVIVYAIFYEPKEQQIIADYETFGHIARHGVAPDGSPPPKLSPEEALALHFTMNYVMTKGILAVAVAVIVLSCGTLTTLLLVLVNRRVTLKQINASMAQISEQLRQLQIKASP